MAALTKLLLSKTTVQTLSQSLQPRLCLGDSPTVTQFLRSLHSLVSQEFNSHSHKKFPPANSRGKSSAPDYEPEDSGASLAAALSLDNRVPATIITGFVGSGKVNKIWEDLEGYKKKLVCAEAIYAESKKTGKPEGIRPTHKTSFLGLIGNKVDSIEFYNEKINELVPKLEAEQKVTLREKQQSAALVFFSSRVTAATAAQSLHARMVDTWTAMDAPEPRQMIWPNLPKKIYSKGPET